MLKFNSILKTQTYSAVSLRSILIILIATNFTSLLGQALELTASAETNTATIDLPTVPENSPNPTIEPIQRFAMEVNNQLQVHFIDGYKPGMSEEKVLEQVERNLETVIAGLDGIIESLRDHSDKLAVNDPETKKLYQSIAAIIHAHLNVTKINNKTQALAIAKTTNLIYEQLEKFLLSRPNLDLLLLKKNLDQYSSNIFRDITTAKKRGDSQEEIKKLQTELDTINQATKNLSNLNKPLELLKWVQTASYDPRAVFLRWYLGVKYAQANAS